MIADINKVAEYSSKISSYSHEAKVNKWLAEQTAITEQISADYLNAPRRRRPRVDPSLLDWKKLTGEENVAVINRITGKKVCQFEVKLPIMYFIKLIIIIIVFHVL